jgi:SagB-type dehydrogenase family enzyme
MSLDTVLRYHEATKHDFGRFARSMGYLDWASQPDPFRRYHGAELVELPRAAGPRGLAALSRESIGDFLRCSMGLSAWKQYGQSRWALRVNPSSGNLHPTEAYIVWDRRVCHYAPGEHALEVRSELESGIDPAGSAFLVGLASIHWREAWKYGERAFRYCQHDVGHAIGALRIAASLFGWRLMLLPRWSDAQVATVLGLDRDTDYRDGEREDADCIAVVTAGDPAGWVDKDPAPLVEAARAATWHGTANRLSTSHVDWPIIDAVAEATKFRPGLISETRPGLISESPCRSEVTKIRPGLNFETLYERAITLQRRSATAFNGGYVLGRDRFLGMLARLQPGAPPWDAIDWPPHVHLAIFVHRVDGLPSGIYAYLRDGDVLDEWKRTMRPEFLWEQPEPGVPLYLLVPIDCRRMANRVSCDQDIAEDGFFSLGMIARLESALRERGPSFYRRLFWECGLIGQVLYLEAEVATSRATGIGCFYDNPVHEILGLSGHEWQSLYHFSMGVPVEDSRLTTEPGYPWEGMQL